MASTGGKNEYQSEWLIGITDQYVAPYEGLPDPLVEGRGKRPWILVMRGTYACHYPYLTQVLQSRGTPLWKSEHRWARANGRGVRDTGSLEV